MTEGKKQEGKHKIDVDLGFGGLFKGLGDFIDLLGSLAESGQEITKSGEIDLKGLGDKGRVIYGFNVHTAGVGTPHVERFGNVRSTRDGPVVTEVREPLVDAFDEDGEILVVAELPGVREEDIAVDVQGDVLSIETTGARRYAKEVLLPAAVEATSLAKTYRNGILELRLKKA